MSAPLPHPVRMRRLARGLAALAVVLQLVGYVYSAIEDVERLGLGGAIVIALAVTYAAVGSLVAEREPHNAIGWMFLGVAISTGLGGFSHTYAQHRLDHDPGAAHDGLVGVAAAVSDVSWVPFILVPVTMLLLLFPDGRLPSPRWRFVARCAVMGVVGAFVTGAMVERLQDFPTVDNPLAVGDAVLEPLTGLSFLLLAVGVGGSVAAIIARYHRSPGVERQQIKWLATAGAIAAGVIPIMVVLYDALPDGTADIAMMLGVLGLPIAAGVAILRYRLYDIDVVINRTLVYGALTGLLAGAYLGSVLLLQLVLSPMSDLAIAGSTLAVAALFRPARGRIQAIVDRRFYRRRYDAQRTLESFATRLRDEVSLDALDAELRDIVRQTMEPAHVSIWLRETTAR